MGHPRRASASSRAELQKHFLCENLPHLGHFLRENLPHLGHVGHFLHKMCHSWGRLCDSAGHPWPGAGPWPHSPRPGIRLCSTWVWQEFLLTQGDYVCGLTSTSSCMFSSSHRKLMTLFCVLMSMKITWFIITELWLSKLYPLFCHGGSRCDLNWFSLIPTFLFSKSAFANSVWNWPSSGTPPKVNVRSFPKYYVKRTQIYQACLLLICPFCSVKEFLPYVILNL